ncbi:MAG: GYF domain-containing protein [Hyphomicrobiaceae bacterium]
MTGQSNEAQWYIARDGKQHGPLTDVEMRTFVGHNYLRTTDLLWRAGMSDWQPAPTLFPAAFQAPPQAPASQPQSAPAQQVPGYGPGGTSTAGVGVAQGANPNIGYAPQGGAAGHQGFGQQPAHQQAGAGTQAGYDEDEFEEEPARGGRFKQILLALVLIGLIGGGAYAILTHKDELARLVSGPPKKQEAAAVEETAPAAPEAQSSAAAPAGEPQAEPAQTAEAQPEAGENLPPDPAVIEGSAIDARLQKIPVWVALKKEYPDWYINNIAAADKLAAENKPQLEISTQLVQGLVNLRREKAPNALAASPEKLRNVAATFLENLRALQAQSVGACYGFISKGELSPVIIEMMETPENATMLNAQLAAIFDAATEGAKSPVSHQPAVKADYDILIGELNKLGWKEEDLQVFSNPRLLAKREPAQVCKMVQDWFSAHLAVQDPAAQDRLLYETLKPVVSG